jgi:hypothetical protein
VEGDVFIDGGEEYGDKYPPLVIGLQFSCNGPVGEYDDGAE